MNRKFTIPINKICEFPTRLGNRFAYPVVVYSAFPKSGSQSIRELIRKVLGTRTSLYIPKIHLGFGNNIISPDKLPSIKQYFKPCLIYGHITPTAYNISELNKGCSKYFFVSIRGLKDVIISYKEHIDKTGFGPLDYRLPGLSEGLPNWPAMADELKFSFIIKFIIPWYVRFIAGWKTIAESQPVRFMLFEDVVSHPGRIQEMIARELQLKPGLRQRKLDKLPKINFNIGENNRGASILCPAHDLELQHQLSFFPVLNRTELGFYLLQNRHRDSNEDGRNMPDTAIPPLF